ncbi:VOC family protein [Brachybacterium saurashtrense]|uniref:VOC family protein n=1 Tax=Brachybacterium saurashtrense TaxID=556288 RepID=UPI0019D0E43B|nr:VOC family protein [Brachybacterium saurashtrense]
MLCVLRRRWVHGRRLRPGISGPVDLALAGGDILAADLAVGGIATPDGEGEIGGLNPGAAPSAEGPLVLLFSEDLDATFTAVKDAGGTVVAGPYGFPGGRRLEFTDPSGNRLGVFADS